MPTAVEFARRLRAARAYADLSQEAMAEALGMSPMTYKRTELGKRELRDTERSGIIQRVAATTGVPERLLAQNWESLANEPDVPALSQIATDVRHLISRERSDLAVYDGQGVVALIEVRSYAPLPGSNDGQARHHSYVWQDAVAEALQRALPDGLQVLREA